MKSIAINVIDYMISNIMYFTNNVFIFLHSPVETQLEQKAKFIKII